MESDLSASGRGNRSRRTIFVTAIVVLLLVIAGGTALAAFVPTVGVQADKSIGDMLPATTVFYVSANLNPTGATRDNLDRIKSAYTSQPGWSTVSSQVGQWTFNNPSSQGQCSNQVQGQVTNLISKLGQDDAVAMTDNRGISLSNPDQAALRHAFVALAPLDTRVTVIQALTGDNSFPLPEKSQTYHGVTIYKRNIQKDFSSCSQATRGTAAGDYYQAIVNNWIVLGLDPQSVFPIVDTAQGKRPALSSTSTYKSLMARVAGNHLGSFYLNGKSLKGVYDFVQKKSTSTGISASTFKKAEVPSAGSLSVDSRGFNLTVVTVNAPGTTARLQSASAAASLVGDDVLALLSVQGLKSTLNSALAQLPANNQLQAQLSRVIPLLHDVTANMSGETDLLISHLGSGSFGLTDLGAPVLMWQVNDEARAEERLRHAFAGLIHQIGLVSAFTGTELRSGTAADGTRYYALGPGSLKVGFAVRKGWAIVSASIPDTLATLSTTPAQPLAEAEAFKRGIPGSFTPVSTWYLSVQGIRAAVEQKYVGSLGKSQQDYYQNNIRPYFAPLQTISGSAGYSSDGRFSIETTIVDIGTSSGS